MSQGRSAIVAANGKTGREGRPVVEVRAKYMVLLLLAEGPKTGYELIKRIREIVSAVGGSASPGTIYPLLRELEERGYIECIESAEESRRSQARRVYRLTERGLRHLLELVERGLYIVEATIELHTRVVEKFQGLTLSRDTMELLRSIVGRLRRIEEHTRRLREVLQEALDEGYAR